MRNAFRLIWAIGVIVTAAVAYAGDWPQFRGPTGQGIADERSLPLTWGVGQNVAWKQEVPGDGWSSPVVRNGRVYLTTAVKLEKGGQQPDRSLHVLSLDAATGKILWDVEVFRLDGGTAYSIHSKNTYASPTPIVTDRHVYVHFGPEGTASLDVDGKIMWRTRELKYPPVHGGGASPILAGDLLFIPCDGGEEPFVAALDKATGRVAWRTPRGISGARTFSFATPLSIEDRGRTLIISPASDAVYGYDSKSGRAVWQVDYPGGFSVVPRPIFAHGLIFICTGWEKPQLFAIRPGGEGNITDTHIVWRTNRSVPNTPSPLVVGDELYMVSDNGIASCLNAKTGSLHWQARLGGSYSASPIYAAGRIYFQDENGQAVVVAADTTFRELARNDLDEQTLSSYAVYDGALFIRTARHLYRIEESKISRPADGLRKK